MDMLDTTLKKLRRILIDQSMSDKEQVLHDVGMNQ